MIADDTVTRYTPSSLRQQVLDILTAWGMPRAAAETTTEVMIDTDLSAIDSHGVSMLMLYEKLLSEGRLNLKAIPEIVRDGPAFAVIDGRDGLGHPVAVQSMQLAIEKARAVGIGLVTVYNSSHFGAVGYYARLASERGLIGLVTTSTRTPVTSATGGSTPILGTNPIAFSAPRMSGEPLVVDMSTSVVALNKVKTYALHGHELPLGWVSDRQGQPVTDASLALSLLSSLGGTLSPLGGPTPETGGHKGFGLSLMVQILSAALSNAAGPGHVGDTDNLGHFFLALDPEILNPGGRTAENVETLLTAVQHDEVGVRIPGDPEREARAERSVLGVPLPDSLTSLIAEICARAGVSVVLTPIEVKARSADQRDATGSVIR